METKGKKDLRIVFMGTPDFGLPCLDMLKNEGYNLVAVFTQPDRPANRGHRMMPPPVKIWAEQNGIPVCQFEKVRQTGVEALRQLKPDLCITAAYGQILSQEILDIPRYGIFNVHASLLPKLRGSAPVQWAIITGEKQTGITIMRTVAALDAGDIIAQDTVEIAPETDAGELYEMLSSGAPLTLRRALEALLSGNITYTPQNEEESTYYPMFGRGFGQIDFSDTAENIYNFVRGTRPFPGSYILLGEMKVKVIAVSYVKKNHDIIPGTIVSADRTEGFAVACRDGIVKLETIQVPGKKPVSSKDYFLGNSIDTGIVLEKCN